FSSFFFSSHSPCSNFLSCILIFPFFSSLLSFFPLFFPSPPLSGFFFSSFSSPPHASSFSFFKALPSSFPSPFLLPPFLSPLPFLPSSFLGLFSFFSPSPSWINLFRIFSLF
ncbi:hypothetical protein, partial [Streptococcus pyogenes]|uniref:hypothetical protein n=1 Tax=Streptococcus pyogenes TaxID=1314 RepID=UPI001CA342D0